MDKKAKKALNALAKQHNLTIVSVEQNKHTKIKLHSATHDKTFMIALSCSPKASRDMLPIFLKKDITRKVKMLDQA